jgi:hypothetical protein
MADPFHLGHASVSFSLNVGRRRGRGSRSIDGRHQARAVTMGDDVVCGVLVGFGGRKVETAGDSF